MIKKRKPKLIPNWKKSWKLFSVQIGVVGMAVASQYGLMYEHLKTHVSPQTMAFIVAGVFALGVLVRIIKQGKDDETKP